MVAVTLAALPPNRYSQAAAPLTTYLSPYFTQNWRLFAPHPISADRSIRVQGAWRDGTGKMHRTAWVNWTDVELDSIRHRIVGGRGGYITNKLYSPLARHRNELQRDQRAEADGTRAGTPLSWHTLEFRLTSMSGKPANDADVFAFLRYDRAATALASSIISARWPERHVIAVRYRLVSRPVVPYDQRNAPQTSRQRPHSSDTTGGWRPFHRPSGNEQEAIADFDRRHK